MIKVGVLGGTGYVGQELIRLLFRHEQVEVVKIMSDSYKEIPYTNVYRNYYGHTELICEEINYDTIADGIDVLFCCLPYGTLMQHLNQKILDRVHVIDLGVDYRLMDQAQYLSYYGKKHQSIQLCQQFTYGLSEWNRENIKMARHICNPGCYATAMLLALLPLIKEKVILPEIIVDGKTSYSASGRTLTVGTHYTEANESIKPYKILHHPHSFERQHSILEFTGTDTQISFVPHVVPMQRGILVSCYTKLSKPITDLTVREVYQKYYGKEAFVELLEHGMYVETKWVKNSNMCHINFELDEETNQIYVFAAIDNLIKGAAGQAIQNMNLMYGLAEDMGLDFVPSSI